MFSVGYIFKDAEYFIGFLNNLTLRFLKYEDFLEIIKMAYYSKIIDIDTHINTSTYVNITNVNKTNKHCVITEIDNYIIVENDNKLIRLKKCHTQYNFTLEKDCVRGE
jgi:hypothetical protein